MKITRLYASKDNAINAQNVIQNLLISEIETLIHSSSPINMEILSVENQNKGEGRECA